MESFKKFQTIPDSNYSVHIDWNFFKEWWKDKEIVIPDFQRGHVWRIEDQIKYIEWIVKGGITGRDIYFNHPNWMGSFEGDMLIIDGLQRSTAVLDFLDGKFNIFDNMVNVKDYKLSLDLYFYVHIHNMKNRKDILQWYLDFNSCGITHTQQELDRVRELIKEN